METSSYPLFVLWCGALWNLSHGPQLLSQSYSLLPSLQLAYRDCVKIEQWKPAERKSQWALHHIVCTWMYILCIDGWTTKGSCWPFWFCLLLWSCWTLWSCSSHFQNWWQHHPGRGLPGDWDAGRKLHCSLQVHQVQSKAMKQVLISGHSHPFPFQQHSWKLCAARDNNGRAWEQG